MGGAARHTRSSATATPACCAPQSLSYVAVYEMLSGETDRAPGDYGFDPLNYKKLARAAKAPLPPAPPASTSTCTLRVRGMRGFGVGALRHTCPTPCPTPVPLP